MIDGTTAEVSILKPTSRIDARNSTSEQPLFAEEEVLRPVVLSLKSVALGFLQRTGDDMPWLKDAIKHAHHLDSIVSEMRHIKDGQIFIIRELQKLRPDLTWNRGGTLQRWRESVGMGNLKLYTDQELDTIIIDHGENGVLGRPLFARSFLQKIPRKSPVFYTLTLGDLVEGLDTEAIGLISEHEYDLQVVKGEKPWPEYLQFCEDRLKIQQVSF